MTCASFSTSAVVSTSSTSSASWWRLGATLSTAVALLMGCQTLPQVGTLASALGSGGSGGGVIGGVQDVIGGASAVLKEYSAEEQQALGRDFSSVLLGARPLLRNELVQRYVNQVGWWVAQQAELPTDSKGQMIHFAWRFGVIDSDAVNAYATPGGYVFITVGLMRKLNNEAQLAGVLAHEIAHVVRGHYLSALKTGGFAQMAGGIVKARANNAVLGDAMVNAVRNLYAKGLDKSDEFDADRQGLLYAARAGYRADGLASVLKMYAATGSESDSHFQMLLSTHPAPAERASRLEPLLERKFASAKNATNEERFLSMRRKL